ncbi:type III glutamate--ammonia ligase [uncultured Amphritea sp.]|uniref:type III glutamate--ammonia ligase n=1 Tax=uncultured Amphritea sp. TaxID=981605 RepID=UPI00260E4A3C|nr:type III glutamate--ammonia ligase [uncultured Amphritea sp.]
MSDSTKTPTTVWQCPDEDALQSAETFLADNGVEYLLAQFVDLHGCSKSKAVPVSCLNMLCHEGAGFAGGAVLGFYMSPQDPEYILIADLSSLKLMRWMPGFASIRGFGYVGGQRYGLDSRNVLAKQTARLAAQGQRLMTGLEPEFYLLSRDEAGTIVPFDRTDTLETPTYDYKGITRNATYLRELHKTLESTGLEVYQIDHEDANGQFELNYKYDEALVSADNLQFFKMAACEIANEMGAICSFMPKLSATTTGNGTHIHCSLVDEAGNNLFLDESDHSGMGLSKTAYHFIAGILEHAAALTAILCPTVNSYKRLVTGTPDRPSWAPVYVAYGDNNRSAMVRIPYGRIEVRIGDGAMNTYLATAAIIAAGLDGIERELSPPPAQSLNFYDLTAVQLGELGVSRLPATLGDALTALEQDVLLAEALGSQLINNYIILKRQEWNAYQATVSAWEIDRYLTFY